MKHNKNRDISATTNIRAMVPVDMLRVVNGKIAI